MKRSGEILEGQNKKQKLEEIESREVPLNCDPNDPALYERIPRYLEQNKVQDALNDLNRALRSNPNHIKALLLRGSIYFEHCQQLDAALDDFNQILKLNPEDKARSLALFGRGQIYFKQQKLQAALDDFNQFLNLNLEENKTRSLALNIRRKIYQICFKQSKFQLLLDDLNQILTITSKDVRALFLRGKVYFKQEKLEDALNDINLALELHPKHPQLKSLQGAIYAKQKKFQEALDQLTPLLQTDPKDFSALVYRGYVYLQQGKFEEALADLNTVLKSHPTDLLALEYVGDVYKKQGELDVASKYYSKACFLNQAEQFDLKGNRDQAALWRNKANNVQLVLSGVKGAFFNQASYIPNKDILSKKDALNIETPRP